MKRFILILILLFAATIIQSEEFIMPMKEFGISSECGYRTDPMGGMEYSQLHKGVDLVGPHHAPIFAIASGIVAEHWIPPGQLPGYKGHETYGGMIVIDHGNGIFTLYAHLSVTFVHEGDFIPKGSKIGHQGQTGVCTGEHLHLEIIIDPMLLLTGDFKIVESFARFWQRELYGVDGTR